MLLINVFDQRCLYSRPLVGFNIQYAMFFKIASWSESDKSSSLAASASSLVTSGVPSKLITKSTFSFLGSARESKYEIRTLAPNLEILPFINGDSSLVESDTQTLPDKASLDSPRDNSSPFVSK